MKKWIVTEIQKIQVTYYAPGRTKAQAIKWAENHSDSGREEILSSEIIEAVESD